MSAREGFVLGCRLLAIYFLVNAIVGALQGYIYSDLMYQQFALMEPSGKRAESSLAYLSIPTVNFFSALLLWLNSPSLAKKAFPSSPQSEATAVALDIPRTFSRLLAFYLITGGIAGLADFAMKFFFTGWTKDTFHSPPPGWHEFASSLVWLLAGIFLYVGAGRIFGGVKGVGNAIADDLWRLKPEDDESTPQA
jgi:hypothetical protein